jgi:hypothetical protein
VAALAFSAMWNARTVRIGHAHGDQRAYVAMAMKFEHFGRSAAAYRLHDVRMRRQGDLVVYTPHEDGEGDLLRQLKAEGTPFYEQPLFHAPPSFAAAIWAAHRVLAADRPFAVLAPDRAATSALSWRERWAAQGYAVIVPWLAALGLVLVAAALGALLGGGAAAALAAWLLAVAPAQALCAQRVWADSLLALCVGAAALAFWRALRRDSWRLALLAGVALGLALCTKNNAVLAVFVLGFACLDHELSWRRRVVGFALSCAVATALVLPWYIEAQRAFGTPWFNPQQPGIAQSHAWFAAINARPWSSYFVATAWQNPAFAVALIGSFVWLLRARGILRWTAFWCLLYIVVLSVETARSEMLGPDERYLLPAYPALAALSARWCVLRRGRARSVVCVALALSAAWSLWLAQRHWDADLILAPF